MFAFRGSKGYNNNGTIGETLQNGTLERIQDFYDIANAIVTTKPGLVLNGENIPGKIMVGIALTGTVPVRIVGKVKKFDRLVADKQYPGYARKRRWYEFWRRPIAIALESYPAGGIINCITKMEF